MTTPELTQWLRDNSSGVYRPAAEAADVIEQLQRERDRLEEALKKIRTTTQGYCYGSWESRLNGICNEALQSLTLK
jgi:hypothetical protein